MNYFPTNLALLRASVARSQQVCAKALGFTGPTWSNYENGKTRPALPLMIRIAEYFNLSLTQLVEDDLTNDPDLVKLAVQNHPALDILGQVLNEPSVEYIRFSRQIEERVEKLEKAFQKLQSGMER